MKFLEKKYFIKNNYQPNKSRGTYEINKRIYWNTGRISQSYYARHSFYKYCKKLIKKKNLKSVLDIGCGPATKLMKLIYPICHNIYCIDQERIIKYCRERYGLNFFFSDDIENSHLNFKKKFDLIIAGDVIEHLLNPNTLLEYIKRYSHPKTYIVISTPERDVLRGKNCSFSPKKDHVREWNKKEFNKYLKNNGFQIIYHSNIQNFKILINFNKSLGEIKKDLMVQLLKINRFHNLEKIKHTQFVICKLKNSNDKMDNAVKKLFEKKTRIILNDLLSIILIKFHFILIKIIRKKAK